MKWGAHEADGRIAAINAKKIRAALRQGIDAKRIFQMYLATHPATSKNPTQDRARARAWAKLNMRINNEPLVEVLQRVWADGYVLGQVSADQAISEAREARKADVKNQVDWSSWKPGDLATAQLLRPSKSFQELLGRARVTINGFDSTTYERVGTALADAIEAGMSETGAAKLINNAISNPARALTIAITEQNRAMSYGAIQRYKESAIERVEWQTINPCKECEQNGGQIVEIGHMFNSGSEMPPQHPHCRCALLPVLPDFQTNEHGVVDIAPSHPAVETYYGNIPHSKLEQVIDKVESGEYSKVHGWKDLAATYDIQGYNGLPTVLPADKFEELLHETGAWTKYYVTDTNVDMPKAVRVYRGMSNTGTKQGVTFAKEYMSGTHFAGSGLYGNGTYSTPSWYTAKAYADAHVSGQGAMLDMIIPDTSNFIEFEDLRKLREEAQSALATAFNNPALSEQERAKLTKMYSLLHDNGTTAALMGYDGIYVKEKNYYVVLNRSKVVINKEVTVIK